MARFLLTIATGLLVTLSILAMPKNAADSGPASMQAPVKAQDPASPQDSNLVAVLKALREQGVSVDTEQQSITIQGTICQRIEPLEYLLVMQPQGKDHEAMFATQELAAEALNAAMLLLGVEKGVNGEYIATDPPPTIEEVQAGVPPYSYTPAQGDGFYIYAQWEREIDGRMERYRYRAEDLVLNIRDETTYQRGRWVYLGSRFVRPHKDAEEFYAAQGEGNLVSLVNFEPANHILAGADPSADNQSIWYPNVYMLPPIGHPVE
ncbi:MAG: YdjY domain-containing protein, partial [Planctomycetota bacterium]|nr:YdjY domain-containing protein [Planctomycetota bacterium]